jgi:hypothetical protein
LENRINGVTSFEASSQSSGHFRGIGLCRVLLFLTAFVPLISPAQVQQQAKPTGSEPVPEPAIAAILAAFDKYEVVGMPEGHAMKDVNDFILLLIRHPAFPEKVNDIAVECGNSLYQPVLDRYIAGADVPFTEVRKVWRNTTAGVMCGTSGFFEQVFPLVRAINQKLPAEKRLRVLAGDPPIDWDQVKTAQDLNKFTASRDESIASVMEKEVLSKHRKALMLFGTYHLMHGVGRHSAVSMYESNYPNVTFVIDGFSGLGMFDKDQALLSGIPFVKWPMPALVRAKGSWLGALDMTHFYPAQVYVDNDCNPHSVFPEYLQKPMAELVDAFLYLAPQGLSLMEKTPADIALDVDHMTEMLRRAVLQGYPGAASVTLKEVNQQTVSSAEYVLYGVPKAPDPKVLAKECLDRKSRTSTPK